MIDVGVGVVTIIYAGGVGIAVAICDCVCVYCLGHDALFEMSVVYRNGREMVEIYVALMREFTKISMRKAEERGYLPFS